MTDAALPAQAVAAPAIPAKTLSPADWTKLFLGFGAMVIGLALNAGVKYLTRDTTAPVVALGWSADEPPAGEPIVGIWTVDGWRSHIVCMVYGAAYPYDTSGIALQAIEYNRPELWTRLP